MIIKRNNTFHLQGKNISYIMTVNNTGDLIHYHFGKKLADRDYSLRARNYGCVLLCNDENGVSLEAEAQVPCLWLYRFKKSCICGAK